MLGYKVQVSKEDEILAQPSCLACLHDQRLAGPSTDCQAASRRMSLPTWHRPLQDLRRLARVWSLCSLFLLPYRPSHPPGQPAARKTSISPTSSNSHWLGRAGNPQVGHMDHTQRVCSLKQPWEKHRARLRSFTARLPFGHIATQHPIQVSPHIEERLSSANNNHTETGQVLYTSLL